MSLQVGVLKVHFVTSLVRAGEGAWAVWVLPLLGVLCSRLGQDGAKQGCGPSGLAECRAAHQSREGRGQQCREAEGGGAHHKGEGGDHMLHQELLQQHGRRQGHLGRGGGGDVKQVVVIRGVVTGGPYVPCPWQVLAGHPRCQC